MAATVQGRTLGSRAETEPTQRSRHYSQGVEPGVEPGMPGLHLLSAIYKSGGSLLTGRALCQSGLWDETAPGTSLPLSPPYEGLVS